MSYTDSSTRSRDDGSIEVPLDDEPKKGDRRVDDRRDERDESRDDRRADAGQADLISGDEGIKRLRGEIDSVRRIATTAQTAAAEAIRGRQAAEARLEEVEKTVVDTELKSAEEKLAAARVTFKAAFEAADPDAIADAQEAISTAAADLRDIQRARKARDAEETTRRGPEGRVEPELPADPVERFIVSNRLTQRSADWLRDHPECVTDEEKYYQMHAADARARRDRIRVGSDEYYQYMEKELGYDTRRGDRRDDDRGDRRDDGRRDDRRSERRPAAPPSRDAPNADGRPSRPASIRLTGDEREMAHLSFPDMKPADAEREYAKNKADLIAEKRIGYDERR